MLCPLQVEHIQGDYIVASSIVHESGAELMRLDGPEYRALCVKALINFARHVFEYFKADHAHDQRRAQQQQQQHERMHQNGYTGTAQRPPRHSSNGRSIKLQTSSTTASAIRFKAGLHLGPCSGAVVGKSRAFYRLVGDTMNTASRLQVQSINSILYTILM
jgi:hypothetical protein